MLLVISGVVWRSRVLGSGKGMIYSPRDGGCGRWMDDVVEVRVFQSDLGAEERLDGRGRRCRSALVA